MEWLVLFGDTLEESVSCGQVCNVRCGTVCSVECSMQYTEPRDVSNPSSRSQRLTIPTLYYPFVRHSCILRWLNRLI